MNSAENLETGKAIMEQMAAQSDLLLSLSTAVIGGTVALFLQVSLKADPKAAPMSGKKTLYGGLFFQFLSVIFAFFTTGAIISSAPVLMSLSYADQTLSEMGVFGLTDSLRLMPIFQFSCFIIGFVLIAIGFSKNLN